MRTAAETDVMVLETALSVLTKALDELVGECLDADGKPKVPHRGSLMKARARLTPSCKNAIVKDA
jgi:hypothetical protein